MADGSETKLAKARQELRILRSRLIDLLDKPQPFPSVKATIKDYVLLLLRHKASIHESRSDLQVDLGILRDLRPKLEEEHTKAKQEFFNAQMSLSCAHKIKSMMLIELEGFLENQIPEYFHKWILQQLAGEYSEVDGEDSEVGGEDSEVDDENLVDRLQLWDARIEKLKRRAEAEGGQLREHKIDYKEFGTANPELVMDQFKAHQKAVDHAHEKADENLCACTHIPVVCESFKNLELFLEARCSRLPDDDIKEAEESQGAHQSKHTDDNAKEAEESQEAHQSKHTDDSAKEAEESRDAHQSKHTDDNAKLHTKSQDGAKRSTKSKQSGKKTIKFEKMMNKAKTYLRIGS